MIYQIAERDTTINGKTLKIEGLMVMMMALVLQTEFKLVPRLWP